MSAKTVNGKAGFKPFIKCFYVRFLIVFGVLFQANINPVLADTTIHQPVWQNIAQSLPENSGIFNRKLRQAVQDNLVLPNVDGSQIQSGLNQHRAELNARLQVLDKALIQFIRVSESSTRFKQLERLMPALYNIEERKLIEKLLKNHGEQVPRLRNSRLLKILDKRIARLANGLIFNMKALVREGRMYESELLQAMANNGVEFSARPPDFILDYLLLPNGKNEEGLWSFYGRVELLNSYEIPVVAVHEDIVQAAVTEKKAEIQSIQVLAELVTNQLKEFLIDSITQKP